MIWGSQYDAMMRWMQDNKVDVTKDIGNNKNATHTTGNTSIDVVKNIYDLYGCHYEWTLEANHNFDRVMRSGNYANSFSLSYRYDDYDFSDRSNYYSSRFSLYIK